MSVEDSSFESFKRKISILWNRHKFLICTLSILSVLCFVYIYFAITLEEDSLKCSDLKEGLSTKCKFFNTQSNRQENQSTAHRHLLSDQLIESKSFEFCTPEDENMNTPCVVSFSYSSAVQNAFCRSDDMPIRLCNFPTNSSPQTIRSFHPILAVSESMVLKDLDFLLKNKGKKWNKLKFVLNIGGSKAIASFFSSKNFSVLSIPAELSRSYYIENLLSERQLAVSLPFTNKVYTVGKGSPLKMNLFHCIVCLQECNLNHETYWKLYEMDKLLIPGGFVILAKDFGQENKKLSRVSPANLVRSLSWNKEQSFGGFTLWRKRDLNKGFRRISSDVENVLASENDISLHEISGNNEIRNYKLVWRHMFELNFEANVRSILNMNSRFSLHIDDGYGNRIRTLNVVNPFDSNHTSSPFASIIHNWCHGFPSPSRAYDLIYAHSTFSGYTDRCDLMQILVELDRLVRPGGKFMIIDSQEVLINLRSKANALRWKTSMQFMHNAYMLFGSKESLPNEVSEV